MTGTTGGTWRQVKENDTEIMAEMGGEKDLRGKMGLRRHRMQSLGILGDR